MAERKENNDTEYRQSFSFLHSVQLLKISWSRGCIQAITFNKNLSVLHRFFNLFRLLLSITPCGNEFHVVTAAWQSASSLPALNQFSKHRNCEGSLPTPLPFMTIQCICSFCNKSSLLCGKEKSQGLTFLWTFPVWLELYCAWDTGTPQLYPSVHWWFLFGLPAWVNIQSLLFLQGVQHFLPAAHWSLCKNFLGTHFKVLLSSLLR